jgi:hypothetical protein
MYLFPEVTVATKAQGPMVVIYGNYAYLLTGSVDDLVLVISTREENTTNSGELGPNDIQKPGEAHLTGINNALDQLGNAGQLDFPTVRFVTVELKKLGAELLEKHFAQAFFETAARSDDSFARLQTLTPELALVCAPRSGEYCSHLAYRK